MKINEVCKVTGLTKKAIDYYQQKKIINPKIDENGYREFNELDVQRLIHISILRALGLSVHEIKMVLDSRYPKEELKKCTIRMQLENELSRQQTRLLERFSYGEGIEDINNEILELNKKKSIKEKLLEVFPGFYGRFFLIHFSQFLEEPIQTEEQKEAYTIIVNFLDEVESPEISDQIMRKFEEAMDFWTDERIAEAEDKKQQSFENMEDFLEDYSEIIEKYQIFKKSEEYESSPYGKLMEIMESFGETSGYNNTFIPAMRKLSPSYEDYYQRLIKANEMFIKKFPDTI